MPCRPTVLPALLAVTLALPLAAQERIPSHCIALAQGPQQVVPVAFGEPLDPDTVRLRFLNHASFLLETPGGLTAITDYTGFSGARALIPDVVTMNNAHSTHWTSTPDPAIPHVLPGWGAGPEGIEHRLDLGEMLVRNVATDTRGPFGEGARANGNSIFIFEVAGLCVGHLGHLHQIPPDEDFAAIGRLDVVLVPVDGGYTMRLEDMKQVVERLRSSIVIPMHWFSGASLEEFLAEMQGSFDVVRLEQPDIVLSLDRLPKAPTVMVLQPDWLD